jgi:hypothetical protein
MNEWMNKWMNEWINNNNLKKKKKNSDIKISKNLFIGIFKKNQRKMLYIRKEGKQIKK